MSFKFKSEVKIKLKRIEKKNVCIKSNKAAKNMLGGYEIERERKYNILVNVRALIQNQNHTHLHGYIKRV